MNDQVVEYSVGTTLPTLVVALQSEEGTPIDLTTATSVQLRLLDHRTSVITVKSCTISSASTGVVTTEITTDLTTEPNELLGRFRVTFASGRVVDVPNAGYLRVRVS